MALITHTTDTTSSSTTATGSIQLLVVITGNAKCIMEINADSAGWCVLYSTHSSQAKVITLSSGTLYRFKTVHDGTSTVNISHTPL